MFYFPGGFGNTRLSCMPGISTGWKEPVSAWSIGGFGEPQAKKSWTCQSQPELSDGAAVTRTLISSNPSVFVVGKLQSWANVCIIPPGSTWEVALPTAHRVDQCVFSERNLGHLSQGSAQQRFAWRLLGAAASSVGNCAGDGQRGHLQPLDCPSENLVTAHLSPSVTLFISYKGKHVTAQ